MMFSSNDRADIMKDFIYGGPDLVMEILSPSNTRRYIESKLADYALIDARECWLVSPEARTVEVLRLDGGEWRRAYIRGPGERIESAVLPGLDLDIAGIFQGVS
jgi:Uma2 family endonuclease